MSNVPSRFGAYRLAAKDVTSLGGDRGFQHRPVEMPEQGRRLFDLNISKLYHATVRIDPFKPTSVKPTIAVEQPLPTPPEIDASELETSVSVNDFDINVERPD